MEWNYKVIKQKHKDNTWMFGIHEVYYDDETGLPFAFTEDSIAPYGTSLKDLKGDFEYMKLAFKEKPIRKEELLKRMKKYDSKAPTKMGKRKRRAK